MCASGGSFVSFWSPFTIALVIVVTAAQRKPEAEKLKNPVGSDAASIEEGKETLRCHCALVPRSRWKGDE
jgi:hypothetical protein